MPRSCSRYDSGRPSSALHDVVINDLQLKPQKPKSAYEQVEKAASRREPGRLPPRIGRDRKEIDARSPILFMPAGFRATFEQAAQNAIGTAVQARQSAAPR